MMHQLVYSNPSPWTSWTRPLASVMIQCRLLSCAVTVPLLAMVTVYANAYCRAEADERSGMYWVRTVTRMPRVSIDDIDWQTPRERAKTARCIQAVVCQREAAHDPGPKAQRTAVRPLQARHPA